MIRVAIIGASGYTGAESIRILFRHSQAELTYLTALPEECGPVEEVFPEFRGRCGLAIEPLDLDKLSQSADVALCCLPHKVSMGFVPKLLDAGVKVIDFSADYRIKDVKVYEKFYQKHTDTANLAKVVYGLPELFRKQIKGTNLVANPGCFPTGAILAMAPLLKEGLIETDSVIVSSVTGASGAGKNPSSKFHFPNMNENLFPYGVGTHRHMPEMEQIAGEVAGTGVQILFQPHVGPFDRGILSSVYARPARGLKNEQLLPLYQDFYKAEPFVRVCKTPPAVKDVAGTNYCHVFPVLVKGQLAMFSAIDNLVKGASGQAIQNMNILFGFDEVMGLK
ncbi:MAG TPA: N-acetyl-gamma-glutamyl-phosphate reductase [Sedimentisphaerales bacterium]|nr:N-acetyl-gamma-glutamyl-phosphate reductase [Sedimentisphaerales bacterium]HRS11681.1 N-acetyl-gamma-glutamyl-phosphate reductase [Sedimentisphaerales bacterium]HRV48344.1 N-acetyl-gamma-glutamyl-phosphate reductase [Sedimentisphaerales bacterium]